jgi:hypothetical protein
LALQDLQDLPDLQDLQDLLDLPELLAQLELQAQRVALAVVGMQFLTLSKQLMGKEPLVLSMLIIFLEQM